MLGIKGVTSDMALHSLNGIAICAGVGMLDEGVRAEFEYFGFDYRTVAYIEREAPAAAQLVALMEAGAIHPAPIWSDLTTFDARPWRGKLDCLTAGFPCQPHSVAGKRAGLEDVRWIWPDITRIIREGEPWLLRLENVPGLISTGGLEHVLFDLARLGFDVEWQVVSAAEVGASHQRERVFILAYRKGLGWRQRWAESEGQQGRQDVVERSSAMADGDNIGGEWSGEARNRSERFEDGSPELADAGLQHIQLLEREVRHESPRGVFTMDDAHGAERGPRSISGLGSQQGHDRGRREADGRTGIASQALGITNSTDTQSGTIFAPGPVSDRWPAIISDHPHLAPAIEPGLRVLADGLALVVDESRADQLRAIGNGVVPLQAAAAFVQLARRAGIV